MLERRPFVAGDDGGPMMEGRQEGVRRRGRVGLVVAHAYHLRDVRRRRHVILARGRGRLLLVVATVEVAAMTLGWAAANELRVVGVGVAVGVVGIVAVGRARCSVVVVLVLLLLLLMILVVIVVLLVVLLLAMAVAAAGAFGLLLDLLLVSTPELESLQESRHSDSSSALSAPKSNPPRR